MRKLSTGADSTLQNYKDLCVAVFGEKSAATNFIQQRIDKEGGEAEVIQDEMQMVYLLTQYHVQPPDNYVVGQAY